MNNGVGDRPDLAQKIAAFDRAAVAEDVALAEAERQRVLTEFPLGSWGGLDLLQYALGPDSRRGGWRSFCWLMEYGTDHLGSIRGGSAAKHIIYQQQNGDWKTPAALQRLDPDEAWFRIRQDFNGAFEAATTGQFDRIDDLEFLPFGQALATKALAAYFPEHFLPIYSAAHISHFTEVLGGRPHAAYAGVHAWQANRELLTLVREMEEFAGWRPHEVMRFLYKAYDPRPRRREVWKIAPGPRGQFWEDCLSGAFICVGYSELGDLTQYGSDQELKNAMDELWPESSGGNLRTARQLLTFRDLEPGALIIANQGKSEVLALGTVTDGYVFETSRSAYKHLVRVRWDESYAQTLDKPVHAWQPTFAKVSDALLRTILAGRSGTQSAETEHAEGAPRVLDSTELPAAVNEVLDALEQKGQVILQGPPGTGKTRLAHSAALALAGLHHLIDAPPEKRQAAIAGLLDIPKDATASRLTMTTFHPSYGYEDFVEGFKPDTAAKQAGLTLHLRDGLFLRVCKAAAKAPDRTFVLIIDEINRGDLPRILGELVTLLEKDKRNIPITLPVSGRQVSVPPNVRIIGTMNTADRSVGHLDTAIRRRFAFLDVPPDLDVLDGEVGGLGLSDFLEGLNARLDKAFGPDRLIGQACLLRDDRPLGTVEALAAAFYHDIVPLIDDHCMGRPELLRQILGGLVDRDTGRIARTNPQDLPGKLAAEFVHTEHDG